MRKFYKALDPRIYIWLYKIYKGCGKDVFIKHLTRTFTGYTKYYNKWLQEKYPDKEALIKQSAKKFKYMPKISIVVPTYNTPNEYLKDLLNSVCQQTYSNWELCIADGSNNNNVKNFLEDYTKLDSKIKYKKLDRNEGISGNTNQAINIVTGEYISFLDHDDTIPKHALFEVVKSLQNYKHDLIYTDEDFASYDNSFYHDPVFKPDWSPDLLMSHNYITHFVTVKKSIVDKVGVLNPKYDGAQDYDFLLRCSEECKSIYHIPQVLYHWRENNNSVAGSSQNKKYAYNAGKKALQAYLNRNKIDGLAKNTEHLGFYTVKYNTTGNPIVSIIIPNKDHIKDLDKCIKSLYNVNKYKNFEIIIVENNSEKEETFKYYEKLKKSKGNLKILQYKGEFNFSKINNFAVQQANGEYILFLNNDTEMIEPTSLQQMLGNCMRKDVGIVGAKLLFADKTIQHAGVVLGFGGFAGHVFSEKKSDSKGYMLRPLINCNYSAVTGACLMIKKDLFNIVDGFNENFKIGLNDIDLCLKVRKSEKLVVYNANTLWYHYESKSRGYDNTKDKKERLNNEIKLFQEIWGKQLIYNDPYYNKNFSINYIPYEMLN